MCTLCSVLRPQQGVQMGMLKSFCQFQLILMFTRARLSPSDNPWPTTWPSLPHSPLSRPARVGWCDKYTDRDGQSGLRLRWSEYYCRLVSGCKVPFSSANNVSARVITASRCRLWWLRDNWALMWHSVTMRVIVPCVVTLCVLFLRFPPNWLQCPAPASGLLGSI